MPPFAKIEDQELNVELSEPEALRTFFVEADRQNGFMLELEASPAQFSSHRLRVHSAGVEMTCRARAVQTFPADGEGRHRVAFELEDWSGTKAVELARKLRQAKKAPAAPPAEARVAEATEGKPETAAQGEAKEPTETESLGTSPTFRIRQMPVPARMRLAMKASRTERQILLRDNSPQVLNGLLSNPRIEDREVLELVRSNYASGEALKRVATTRRWAGNAEIRAAVVKNPKTPTPLALRLLESLRTPELGTLAKAGATREKIRRAALNLYLQRVSRR